ncbi:M23 family metallopeptidase [Halodesulfovibrio sp.]|jgi:murein DD-endopeptidase MepM/ murein hydrolase activator NlpD|uniref:M23 family metallopeptidase n=1 Tax=Halodesulfovibrio sp. TaxID=1912772 RepID=UPI0025DD8A8F|nr:M23 family metallopeptidase [Halodesulfovibrio sp.]MCT4626430.1 M23 family metallopeptidase [Halodesulfovibrio sp.]
MKSYFLKEQHKDYLFFTIALLLIISTFAPLTFAHASATVNAAIEERYNLSNLISGWKQINPKSTPSKGHAPENTKLKTVTIKVKKGDTLYRVLRKAGVSLQQQRKIVAITSKQKAFHFDVGLQLKLTMRTSPETKKKEVTLLSVQLDNKKCYAIRLQSDGSFKAAIERTQYKGQLQHARGTIKNTFVQDAQYAGLPASLAAKAHKLLTQRKKLTKKDLKNSDFEVIYEVYPKESGIPPRIQYVRLDGVYSMQLFFFEGKSGSSYYDADGNTIVSKGKIKLVDNARLSSKFGYRNHPVLKRRILHKGIDYAAPTGTPIHAAADGTIEFVGRKGGYGKHIAMRHDKSTKTTYSHLHKYKKGLKSGAKVKAGDVIGYVGSTGRSTGPHLHFEVHKNGKAVDPLKAELPRPSKLEGTELAEFKLSQVRMFLQVAKQRLMKSALASLKPEAIAKAAL